MKAEDIRVAIRKRYSDQRQYAVAEEVGITTGCGCRRLDMMILDCFCSNGFRIDGIEIKVSTSDLRRELEDPEKHIAFFDVIDYYSLAVPAGIAEPLIEIIPKKWGIMIIDEDGNTRYKRRPLALEDVKADRDVPRGFFSSVVRNIQTHQPSKTELRNEYNRGFQEGKSEGLKHYDNLRAEVQQEHAKLEAYDKLENRFALWGKDVNKSLDDFEAFQKLNVDYVLNNLDRSIKQLSTLKNFLELRR